MQTPNNTTAPQASAKFNNPNIPAAILSGMMFLLPALGVPSELMLQDTLKSAIAAFGILTGAFVFFWQRREQSTSLKFHSIVWLPILLMVYALGSMAWSHTYLAAVEAIRWFLFALTLWIGINIFTQLTLPLLIWGIHAGAVTASIWATLQFCLDLSLFPQLAFPASTFVNRNFFSEYIVCTIPFSVWILFTMRDCKWLGLISLSIAINIVAVMMTGTRSALITILILIPVFIIILSTYYHHLPITTWTKKSKVIVGLVLIGSILSIGSIPCSINSPGNGKTAIEISFLRAASIAENKLYKEEGSIGARVAMWESSLRMIMAHPLAGVGAGAWEIQVPLYQQTGETVEIDHYSHNEYLHLLGEYGLIVGGLFLITLFIYLLKSVRNALQLKDKIVQPNAILRAFTLTSLLALFIVSIVGFPWHLAATTVIFSICLCLLTGSDTHLNTRGVFFVHKINWHPKFSITALIFLACCLITAIHITIQAMRVEYKIVQAIQLGNSAVKLHNVNLMISSEKKERIISNTHEAISINPHYRKLIPLVADRLATIGDWENAMRIWESTIKSRPYVAELWSSMAIGHARLGENAQALEAAKIALQLQPKTPGMHALEVNLLSQSGQEDQAKEILTKHFNDGTYDYALAQSGYALGLKTHDWPLAIHSLELRNKKWPKQAADGYFRLGNIYAEIQDDTKALESFRLGLRLVPLEEKDNFTKQVPEAYRDKL